MADKPVAEVVDVDAVIDALSPSPTSSDVYEATLPFNPHAVAASAVRRAGEGGGGGGTGVVSCLLARDNTFDVTTVEEHPVLWDALYDNTWDFNTLVAIPTGLGLSFAFDGSADEITTTDDGVWALTYNLSVGQDAAWVAKFNNGFAQFGLPTSSSLGQTFLVCVVAALPSGAALKQVVNTTVEAASGPYGIGSVSLLISRIG